MVRLQNGKKWDAKLHSFREKGEMKFKAVYESKRGGGGHV